MKASRTALVALLAAAVVACTEEEQPAALAEQMAGQISGAGLRLIPKAGHAIHLENPFAWLAAVRAHLARARS